MEVALGLWFAYMYQKVHGDLVSRFAKDITTGTIDWNDIQGKGVILMKPEVAEIYKAGGVDGYKILGVKEPFDILNVDAMKKIDKSCGKLVRQVSSETKKGIREAIRYGIAEGRGMDKIARDIRPLIGLTSIQTKSVQNFKERLIEKRPDLSTKNINKRTQAYAEKTKRRRAETIARTETARIQTLGYVDGLSELGVSEVEFSISPSDYCVVCAELNGKRFSLEEGATIIPVHPRCRCAMLPVVGDNVISEPQKTLPIELPGTMAPEGGMPAWKDYLAQNRGGDKSTSAVLYDFYKLRYESTGKIAPSGLKHLKRHASKFEVASVKISKPIPGLGDVIKPVVKPPIPKPVEVVPKPKPISIEVAQEQWWQTLPVDEQKAIKLYQGYFDNARYFREVNSGKLSEDILRARFHARRKVTPTQWTAVHNEKYFSQALEKAPNFEGICYRGLTLTEKQLTNLSAKGTMKFNAYASSTTKLDDAYHYLGVSLETAPKKKAILLELKTKTGANITNISNNVKNEIMIKNGTEYRISSVTKIKIQGFKDDVTKIVLEEVDKAKKLPGVLPKSYYSEKKGWEERLVQHKEDLRQRMGMDVSSVKMNRMDLPEFKEALNKFETAVKSYTKPIENLKVSRKEFYTTGWEKKWGKNYSKFCDKIEEIGCDDMLRHYGKSPISAHVHRGQYRANAHPQSFTVDFGSTDSLVTQFHEYGHLAEGDWAGTVKYKCRNWLRQRSHGERPIPYRKIAAWSKDPQMAYKDKFIDTYVGKIYRNGDTEVMSMGMQQFTSYKSMMRFAKKDFDHFSLIHGILTGAI